MVRFILVIEVDGHNFTWVRFILVIEVDGQNLAGKWLALKNKF